MIDNNKLDNWLSQILGTELTHKQAFHIIGTILSRTRQPKDKCPSCGTEKYSLEDLQRARGAERL